MSNKEQAIREMKKYKWVNNGMKADANGLWIRISDLTALISEHYYPKEFTNYCIKNVEYCREMGKEWYQIMQSGVLILKTLDEVYEHWKTNEQ